MDDKELSRIRSEKIGVIPQGRSAVDTLSVYENILLPGILYGGTPRAEEAENWICVAMKKLKENGCIMMNNRSTVYLTDKGYSIARQFYDRYKTLKRFLIQLGVDEQIAARDACKMEHGISDENLTAISGLLTK